MKTQRIALYFMAALSVVAAIHAQTLDAPTLVYQEYREHFLVRQSTHSSQGRVKQAISEVRAYLTEHMKDLSENRIDVLSHNLVRLSDAYEIPAGLILSIIKVESDFQPWAISPRGALGLMQLMPETGQWIASRYAMKWDGPTTLLDEEMNTEFGVRYLAYLKDKYGGDLRKMLSAYNRGPAKVDEDVNEGRSLTLEYYTKIQSYVPKLTLAQGEVERFHAN